MNYVIAADTDIGIKKSTNQDSLLVKTMQTPRGKMCFAILCDGMGGLAEGEMASRSLIQAFETWFTDRFPLLFQNQDPADSVLRKEWAELVQEMSNRIMGYGNHKGIHLGTTLTGLLLTPDRYTIVHVGDSRCYEIAPQFRVITEDQTVVAQELRMGRLTPDQAARDPRRSVLLQAVGTNANVEPAFYFGQPHPGMTFMLCSDGFRHVISEDEIYQYLGPHQKGNREHLTHCIRELIQLNISRKEEDNISAVVVRVTD